MEPGIVDKKKILDAERQQRESKWLQELKAFAAQNRASLEYELTQKLTAVANRVGLDRVGYGFAPRDSQRDIHDPDPLGCVVLGALYTTTAFDVWLEEAPSGAPVKYFIAYSKWHKNEGE